MERAPKINVLGGFQDFACAGTTLRLVSVRFRFEARMIEMTEGGADKRYGQEESAK